MKRFLAKVALLLGAALVFTIGINAAYIALNRFPPDHTGKFAEVPDSIQIANLGSSHGFYSFNYDDLVKSIGAEPVLVTTPLLKEYNDAVDKNVPGVYDDFYGRIDSVVSATGVRYFDYSHDERFSNRHDFFMDADHMNKRGAILFTATLVDDALDLD